jgi:hypothetical protein
MFVLYVTKCNPHLRHICRTNVMTPSNLVLDSSRDGAMWEEQEANRSEIAGPDAGANLRVLRLWIPRVQQTACIKRAPARSAVP